MQSLTKSVILTVTPDGVIICPNCGKVIRGVRVMAETEAKGLEIYCRYCKAKYRVEIEGQRLQGQRQ